MFTKEHAVPLTYTRGTTIFVIDYVDRQAIHVPKEHAVVTTYIQCEIATRLIIRMDHTQPIFLKTIN
jgi:hypothetical protein